MLYALVCERFVHYESQFFVVRVLLRTLVKIVNEFARKKLFEEKKINQKNVKKKESKVKRIQTVAV